MEEDEEEIHSQTPPSSPPNNGGRITVSVASATTPPPPQEPPPPTHKPTGGGREDCWSEGATGVLIDAWGERYLELSRGNLKQKHWREVAEIVSSRGSYSKTPKTDIQCKNRIDTVKKKYKLEKARIASGGGPSKWVFFEKLDHLIGPTAKISKIPVGIPVRASNNANLNSSNQFFDRKNHMGQLQLYKKRPPPVAAVMEWDEEDAGSAESADSLPPSPQPVKKRRTGVEFRVRGGEEVKGKGKWRRSEGVWELTQAILRFGDVYEKAESAKLMQVEEMEKQRMKFVKELELQKMQFFMKTQLEISQLKVKGRRRRRGGGGGGGGGNSNGNQFHNCNDINDNNSDSCN